MLFRSKAPETKIFAQETGIPVYQPEDLNDTFLDSMEEFDFDLAVILAYGKIINQRLIDLPKFGCVNLHASLLPHLRGAAPIQWSILNGDTETGITLQKVVKK